MPVRRQSRIQMGGRALPADAVFTCPEDACQRGRGKGRRTGDFHPRLERHQELRPRQVVCHMALHHRFTPVLRPSEGNEASRFPTRRHICPKAICHRRRQPADTRKQRMDFHHQNVGSRAQRKAASRIHAMPVRGTLHTRGGGDNGTGCAAAKEQPVRSTPGNTQAAEGVRI